jgi:hypothetical protein
MVLYRTGITAFDNLVAQAEATRQASLLTATKQSDWDAADLAFYTAVVQAGVATNTNTPNEYQAMIRLKNGQKT